MGESKKDSLRVQFDNRVRLEFHGAKVTSDAGLLAYRELYEQLGLTAMGDAALPKQAGEARAGLGAARAVQAGACRGAFDQEGPSKSVDSALPDGLQCPSGSSRRALLALKWEMSVYVST